MNRACLSLALVLALSAGCAKETIPPKELTVGRHRISVVLPEGWEYIDYGDRHHLRQDFRQIVFEDLGWQGSDFGKSVDRGLHELKERERRDEASRDTLDLDGHEAVIVDTWDRLSHQERRRFLFAKVGDELLTIYMMRGEFDAMEPAFDVLVASLALVDSLGSTGPEGRQRQPE